MTETTPPLPAPDPSRAPRGGVPRGRRAHARAADFVNPALAVEAVGVRAVGRPLAGRDGDAVVHEPRAAAARPRPLAAAAGRRKRRYAFPGRRLRIHRRDDAGDRRLPDLLAVLADARVRRTRRRRGWWRPLAREALFDAANAEPPSSLPPISPPRPSARTRRVRSPSCRSAPRRRCRSATSCAAACLEATASQPGRRRDRRRRAKHGSRPMSLEGELTVRLAWDGRRIVRRRRRVDAAAVAGRLAVGKTADEAAAMVPRLYSICGHAQARGGALRRSTRRPALRPPRRRCGGSRPCVLETSRSTSGGC